MRAIQRTKQGLLVLLALLMLGIFSASPGTARGATYYLQLVSISNIHRDDDFGADEPRLYVNGQQVWAADGWSQGETTTLNVDYPFYGDSLPIVIQEYDRWPSSTITLNPSPFTVPRAEVPTSTAAFTRGAAVYQLTYRVVLR